MSLPGGPWVVLRGVLSKTAIVASITQVTVPATLLTTSPRLLVLVRVPWNPQLTVEPRSTNNLVRVTVS